MHTCSMKGLASVAVADPDTHSAAHKEALDGSSTPYSGRRKPIAAKTGLQRLDTKVGEMSIVHEAQPRANEDEAKSTRVAESKPLPSIHREAHVLVRFRRDRLIGNRQPTAHTKMNDELVCSFEANQQVLGTSPDSFDAAADTATAQRSSVYSFPQVGAVHPHVLDPSPYQPGGKGSPQDFDFG
jgi:hypothetical protein